MSLVFASMLKEAIEVVLFGEDKEVVQYLNENNIPFRHITDVAKVDWEKKLIEVWPGYMVQNCTGDRDSLLSQASFVKVSRGSITGGTNYLVGIEQVKQFGEPVELPKGYH